MSTIQEQTKSQPGRATRKDVVALWLGIIISVAFTGIIWLAGERLKAFPHLPDQGSSWSYWKLPAATLAGRLSSWGLYLAHQFVIWGLIWYAQKHIKKYTTGLHTLNWWALGASALFMVLHLLQTHLWYDGLAQDVSIFSSQGSVIVLLIWVMLMENNRRGLFFGKRLPISQRIIHWARKYHAYYFSWAAIFTFWFHPTENPPGHLIGFFYMFMIMLQGSLFFTRIHTNKYWTFTLELLVLIHGTLVAVQNANNLWPMFFFGFGGIFVITQMYGLNLKRWMRWGFLLLYVGGASWIYSQRGISRLWELTAIPLIDYLSVIVLALLIGGGLWLYDRIRPERSAQPEESGNQS